MIEALSNLTRPQLIALAVQKTGREYKDIITHKDVDLVRILLSVENVLDPVQA